MPKKKKTQKDFNKRLSALRKSKGVTQAVFAEKIGISRRALAHYETKAEKMPCGDVLIKMAVALDVSTDELLGKKSIQRNVISNKEARLINKLNAVLTLKRNDQKSVIRYIDALTKTSSP
jgi:transcriptional regulator with XRE-family HTH domain